MWCNKHPQQRLVNTFLSCTKLMMLLPWYVTGCIYMLCLSTKVSWQMLTIYHISNMGCCLSNDSCMGVQEHWMQDVAACTGWWYDLYYHSFAKCIRSIICVEWIFVYPQASWWCPLMYGHVAPLSLYDVHLCMLVVMVSSVQKSSWLLVYGEEEYRDGGCNLWCGYVSAFQDTSAVHGV